MTLVLFSLLFLIIGVITGWLAAERYIAFMEHNEHEFEELFKENPHPEIYNNKGELNRGDYITMVFDPGFDPDDWDPETDIRQL